jgi:hypothetical protein
MVLRQMANDAYLSCFMPNLLQRFTLARRAVWKYTLKIIEQVFGYAWAN